MKESFELLALLGVSEGILLLLVLIGGVGLITWRLAKLDSRIGYLMKKMEEMDKTNSDAHEAMNHRMDKFDEKLNKTREDISKLEGSLNRREN